MSELISRKVFNHFLWQTSDSKYISELTCINKIIIILVTEFSKKTGDYRNLSAVDIRVLALTLQLEKEFGDASRIKVEPDKKVSYIIHMHVVSCVILYM